MGDEVPVTKVRVQFGDIVPEEGDVDIKVGPGNAAKPGIDSLLLFRVESGIIPDLDIG